MSTTAVSNPARWWGSVLTAVLLVATTILALVAGTAQASAAGSFPSSRVADLALPHVGQQWNGDCWPFVQQMIQASGGPNISAQAGGGDYFAHLRNAGGQPVPQSQLSRGDVVQQGRYGGHTFIVVRWVSATTFQVVDSNHDNIRRPNVVLTYNRNVVLDANTQAFRFGRAAGGGGGGQPTTAVFPVMNTSEQPPDGVWFRDNPNLPGPRLNGLGVYAGDRVQLRCYGTGPAMGPGANRVWYQVNNLTRPNAPGRANTGWLNAHFINDGLGPNQIDPGLPVC